MDEFIFKSGSRPGKFYTVRQAADGSWYCDCPKWRFQPGVAPVDRRCKHLDHALKSLIKWAAGERETPEPPKSEPPKRIGRPGAYWR